jgi:hypothetical protein
VISVLGTISDWHPPDCFPHLFVKVRHFKLSGQGITLAQLAPFVELAIADQATGSVHLAGWDTLASQNPFASGVNLIHNPTPVAVPVALENGRYLLHGRSFSVSRQPA